MKTNWKKEFIAVMLECKNGYVFASPLCKTKDFWWTCDYHMGKKVETYMGYSEIIALQIIGKDEL